MQSEALHRSPLRGQAAGAGEQEQGGLHQHPRLQALRVVPMQREKSFRWVGMEGGGVARAAAGRGDMLH